MQGCNDPGAMSAARKACVGETNCTVSVREFHARCLKDVDGGAQVILKRHAWWAVPIGKLDRLWCGKTSSYCSPPPRGVPMCVARRFAVPAIRRSMPKIRLQVMVTALCGPGDAPRARTIDGPERRANNLRYEFELEGAALSGVARVGALGYHVLYCNSARVSQAKLEPGRASEKHVFYSTFDLQPCVVGTTPTTTTTLKSLPEQKPFLDDPSTTTHQPASPHIPPLLQL